MGSRRFRTSNPSLPWSSPLSCGRRGRGTRGKRATIHHRAGCARLPGTRRALRATRRRETRIKGRQRRRGAPAARDARQRHESDKHLPDAQRGPGGRREPPRGENPRHSIDSHVPAGRKRAQRRGGGAIPGNLPGRPRNAAHLAQSARGRANDETRVLPTAAGGGCLPGELEPRVPGPRPQAKGRREEARRGGLPRMRHAARRRSDGTDGHGLHPRRPAGRGRARVGREELPRHGCAQVGGSRTETCRRRSSGAGARAPGANGTAGEEKGRPGPRGARGKPPGSQESQCRTHLSVGGEDRRRGRADSPCPWDCCVPDHVDVQRGSGGEIHASWCGTVRKRRVWAAEGAPQARCRAISLAGQTPTDDGSPRGRTRAHLCTG